MKLSPLTNSSQSRCGHGSRQQANKVSDSSTPCSKNSSHLTEQANAVCIVAVGCPSGQGISWAAANHTIMIPEDSPLLNLDGLPVQPPIAEAIDSAPVLLLTHAPVDDNEQSSSSLSESSSSVWSRISYHSEPYLNKWIQMELMDYSERE